MQKLKILHYMPVYAPAWQFGGPVLSVSQLCEGLVALGHEVEVFTSNAGLITDPAIPINQPVMRNGVKVIYFAQEPGMGIFCPGMESEVARRVKEFDILHITGVWQRTSWAACRAAKENQVPYIVSLRGALGPYSWKHKTFKKVIYYLLRERYNVKNAAAVHYTTQQELDECRWLNLPGTAFIVPNGLDLDSWKPNKEAGKAWRKKQSLDQETFLLLNVGRLHHKKGLDLLPEALAPLQALNWQMIFLGKTEGQTQKNLEKHFEALNLSGRVRFLASAPPDELPAIYSAANLFVLPSRHENFGNVVIEALACECPVLISDQVGLHHELRKSETGWVLPRITKQWTGKLQELIDNETQLDGAVSRARAWIEQGFSHQSTASLMASYYLRFIQQYVE